MFFHGSIIIYYMIYYMTFCKSAFICMLVCVCICPAVCLLVCLAIYLITWIDLPLYQSTYLCICAFGPSINLWMDPSMHPTTWPSTEPSINLWINAFICPSFERPIYQIVHLSSIHLSICPWNVRSSPSYLPYLCHLSVLSYSILSSPVLSYPTKLPTRYI